MSDTMDSVTVTILGKEFKLSCPPDERIGLMQAAEALDERMKQARNAGVIGIERIAVMVAINLAWELQQERAQQRGNVQLGDRLERLLAQADEELQACEQLRH